MTKLRCLLGPSGLALAVCFALSPPSPAGAQFVVFDPSNYAQNVLTATRELQQVNNEIQSLQNEATMLTNQARNLAARGPPCLMKRRPPCCAVRNSMTLPAVDPATATPAHSQATEGRSTAIRTSSASNTPATGIPSESRMASTRIPAGPQAIRAAVRL